MSDRSISFTSAVSAALWVLGVMLVMLDIALGEDAIGRLGFVVAMGGATLSVRSFICTLAYRERNAFEMGREYAEGQRAVRSLRPR